MEEKGDGKSRAVEKIRRQDHNTESSQGRVGTYTFAQKLQGAQAQGHVNEERVALLPLRFGPESDGQRVKASDGRASVVEVDVVEIGVLQESGVSMRQGVNIKEGTSMRKGTEQDGRCYIPLPF